MKLITKLTFILICTLFAINCNLLASYAAIPHLINYQGKLTDSIGKPVADGSYSVAFKIYDQVAAGALLWSETQTISVQKGIFSVMLGGVTALNLIFDKPYWLSIQVGSDLEMTPRQQITSAGYAFRAENADNASNATQAQKIEARTSDPASPTTGQMWLRTDL